MIDGLYFNTLNKKGIRRRGFKFLSASLTSKKLFFRKRRFKRLLPRSRVVRKRIFRLRTTRRLVRRPRRRARRLLSPHSFRIKYSSDSRFFSKKVFFKRKKGYINSHAIRSGETSIFRTRLNPVRFPFPFSVLFSKLRVIGFSNKRLFSRLRNFWYRKFTPKQGFRAYQVGLILNYLRTLFIYISKSYSINFKFYARSLKRSLNTHQFFKRFGLFKKPETFKKLMRNVNLDASQNIFSYDSISFYLLKALKLSYDRFFRRSYSFFFYKNTLAEKNKRFFEKFRFKLSTYLALHQSLSLAFYKHYFLNNAFFIRFIPTNSNFFITFGFYDQVIFQISAGQPIVGFPNSSRSIVPAVTNLVRYFALRIKRFVKNLFPMIFQSPIRFSRPVRRRLKIPVYYIMEKGVDRRVKVAFKQMMVQSFWRSMGIRVYTPLPHAHTLRVSKRRRR